MENYIPGNIGTAAQLPVASVRWVDTMDEGSVIATDTVVLSGAGSSA